MQIWFRRSQIHRWSENRNWAFSKTPARTTLPSFHSPAPSILLTVSSNTNSPAARSPSDVLRRRNRDGEEIDHAAGEVRVVCALKLSAHHPARPARSRHILDLRGSVMLIYHSNS